MKQGYIYIMSNKKHGTLYVGVTSNLIQRVYQHKHHLIEGFTKRYNLNKLVYFEQIEEIRNVSTYIEPVL
ncbi:GIY-YIG nuclease family protein [Thiomicrospira microaerophila]|uniref:GIY-YIG nuclease family protein n=1 Tax=Thiomicrospira microaerophila TaxID=406020 RepID=UPI0024B09BFA|nr:GIY-YIG nuclease family protein [Thiomicrospira microaerophila]UQB43367.1 GIY-YIG nuclease family protein [Thiomicrospira microaerophila]